VGRRATGPLNPAESEAKAVREGEGEGEGESRVKTVRVPLRHGPAPLLLRKGHRRLGPVGASLFGRFLPCGL